MKLAEALTQRKNLKDEIEELKQRAAGYAVIQEGNERLGSAGKVLEKIGAKITRLKELIIAINRANLETVIEDRNETLMGAIIDRDMLKLEKSILDHVADNATSSRDRYSRNEIRMIPTIDIDKLRSRSDSLAKKYRLLDAEIQAKNWTTEIIE